MSDPFIRRGNHCPEAEIFPLSNRKMETYKITVRETVQRNVTVTASNAEQAFWKAFEASDNVPGRVGVREGFAKVAVTKEEVRDD